MKIPDGYRELNEGEKLQEGDVYWKFGGNELGKVNVEWHSYNKINDTFGRFRKITLEKPKDLNYNKTMKNFKIDCSGNPELAEFLMNLARKYKCPIDGCWNVFSDKSPYFSNDIKGIGFAEYDSPTVRNNMTLSVEEIIKEIKSYKAEKTESFQDNDKTVVVSSSSSVTYGCTTVSKEIVDRIFELRVKVMAE